MAHRSLQTNVFWSFCFNHCLVSNSHLQFEMFLQFPHAFFGLIQNLQLQQMKKRTEHEQRKKIIQNLQLQHMKKWIEHEQTTKKVVVRLFDLDLQYLFSLELLSWLFIRYEIGVFVIQKLDFHVYHQEFGHYNYCVPPDRV